MKAVKKTFNDIKIGDTIYAYDYELNYGFKMKVTKIINAINYNNDAYTYYNNNAYTWFACEKLFDHKGYVVIIANKEKVKTSFKNKIFKMVYFVNEKDYNNKIY